MVAAPEPASPTPTPLVSLRGISKRFPGVQANADVDLDIYPGEIHALLGENGAGKSTLAKILYGFYRSDAGRILVRGETVAIHSPLEGRRQQIGMVFQDFTLIPAFSVAENIALFLPDLNFVMDGRAVRRRIESISRRYELEVDPDALVSQLSIGEQQKVELIKQLLADARILILDEPTRVLALHEVDALFRVLEGLRRDGYAILLITHKLKEVLQGADRITVLRGGRVAGSLLRAEASEDRLVGLMFSRKVDRPAERHPGRRPPAYDETPVLKLQGLSTRGEGAETSLKDIDLSVYPGEIVGVAGVSGNGQRELGDVILGMTGVAHGRRILLGEDATALSVGGMRRRGVGFVAENPLTMSAVPFMTVLENLVLTQIDLYARRGGWAMNWDAVRAEAVREFERFGFSLPLDAPARSLSGGNLQRMVIVRELAHRPRLIVASYLTRGLDVQSAEAARRALVRAREDGAGVLLMSEDLEELLALSDRLVVLFAGRIAGIFCPEDTDAIHLGRLMTGGGETEIRHG